MKVRQLFFTCICILLVLSPLARGADSLLITEFMAVNSGTLLDEDGDSSDWIEIYNSSTNVASLNGWFLTDKAADLTQWRFPSTNLAPHAFLIVFASGKDRRVPGAPLHTNFKLDNTGEYLALVRPDGTSIASAYAPRPQVSGVSYGIPARQMVMTLVPTGATARVLVPHDDSLGTAWTMNGFEDGNWLSATTGVGYETDSAGAFVPATIANSVTEFSGIQGQNNWVYGYWNKRSDPNGIYSDSDFTAFPGGSGPFSTENYWNGTAWDWFNGDPPFTQLTAEGGRATAPGGNPAAPDQWAIRRYVNEFNGPVTISGKLTHTSDWVYVTQTGVAGNNTMYMYLNGPGEGYIDDIKLVAGSNPEQGANLLVNGDFELASLAPWTVSPNLIGSVLTTAVKHSGTRSLRMVSTAAGTTQGSSIWQATSPPLTVGQTYTLSYWYFPATNSATLTVRFSGSWITTTPAYCGDGGIGRIYVDGVQVFQQGVFVSSVDYSLTVPAHLGSKIDFAIDPGPLFSNACDGLTFTSRIETSDVTLTTVADSAADWSLSGNQGENNWYYGYYNQTTDPTPGYQMADFKAFPRDGGPHGSANFWNGTEWRWWNGDPPFDEIGRTAMMPNGIASGDVHWAIRRWVSTVNGRLSVDWTLDKELSIGGGITARVFHNGAVKDAVTLSGTATNLVHRSIQIANVRIGDVIDFALDPLGADTLTGDLGDRTLFTAVIRGSPNLTSQIAGDIQSAMRNVNASVYLRFPFLVEDPSQIDSVTLRMKYDDGFVAYLNGMPVAGANGPEPLTWNSAALSSRSDAAASKFEEFNLTPQSGFLHPGDNVLAIHGLNASAGDSDCLILPELIVTTTALDLSAQSYFSTPTPATPNNFGTTNLGPLVLGASHAPAVPGDTEDLVVTAQVQPTFNLVNSVSLIYRVMYSNEVTAAMFDDGQHGDGLPGDGTYGAVIPANASRPGQMVRYYVFAQDTLGNGTRLPAFADPGNSPGYLGTVVRDPSLTNPLPVIHMFAQEPALATTRSGTRCSLFYDEEFYDNVAVTLHGQSTPSWFDKDSMGFDMNRGAKFRWNRNERRVSDFNLLTTAPDKAYVRQIMAYESFRDAGAPYHYAFGVRLQQNGAFNGIFQLVESGDDDFLTRIGLDPEGAFYKIYLPLTNAYVEVFNNGNFTVGAEKKTRRGEDNADLAALITGLSLTGPSLRQFIFDNFNIPECLNFFAVINLVANEDCCWYKNFYLYRDSNGSGEWQIMPWDLDLTFGRTFNGTYRDPTLYITNAFFLQRVAIKDFIGINNGTGFGHTIGEILWTQPDIYDMFLRRWTTVHEELLQRPATHPLLLKYERRATELMAQIGPDTPMDIAMWPPWTPFQTITQAVDVLKNQYWPGRRNWIFNQLPVTGGPNQTLQTTNTMIHFGAIEFNPSSQNQAQEYVQLVNTNRYSVDISGWKLSGAIDMTFQGGTVIASNSVLYVSPDVKAFRARTSGPRGGQGLFVQGNYHGQLSSRGEALQLTDKTGRLVRSTNYLGSPSLQQRYLRITEIMYSPSAPPPGLATNADEFEYIELKNTGPVPFSLVGVRFVNGVEFDFTTGIILDLAPGATVLVVRNLAAFVSRYGGGRDIAGQYAGQLDNRGENLRLVDANGEVILDFHYDPDWYPITEGIGFSLEIADENAPWDSWNLASSWRPSRNTGGSPARSDPASAPMPGIVVSEVLTHTLPPLLDAVELYNPLSQFVNIGGWYITDDFNTPKKFRIPDSTILPPHSYLSFNETSFNQTNPPSPTSFSFSSMGDEVYLFSGDKAGNLTGYFHGYSFGAAETGVSFGRHVNSVGEIHFVAQKTPTLGEMNAGPKVGPVVLSEIAYRPPDRSGEDDAADEFIEINNITEAAVPLYHPQAPINTWRLRGGVDLDFPPNLTLPPGGYLIAVGFDPANLAQLSAFRARYGIAPGVPIIGPYSGKLDNSADEVRLFRPDAPAVDGVPYILVDEVDYRDSAPWTGLADGTGATLQRRLPDQYGNDPLNWTAAAPTPGRPYVSGTAPVIVAQPASLTILASGNATFSVAASGAVPLRYQWRTNGVNLDGATNDVLSLTNVQQSQAGSYQVTVFNAAGSVQSSNATLSVFLGAYFITQPRSTNARPGINVTFTSLAVSGTPITYQWRFNGAPLANATSPSLVLTNIQAEQAGVYTVIANDGTGGVSSQPATLSVVLDPTIVQQPLSQAVVEGATVVLSVTVTNNATLPIGFRWQRNNIFIPDGVFVLNERTSYYVVSSASPTFPNYRVVVTNASRSLQSTIATLTFLTDTDGDGLPDSWEIPFGLDELNPGDRDEDFDGDGRSNWEEYVSGTDPLDDQSYLKIGIFTTGPGATLSFLAASNKTYSVLYTDALGNPVAGTSWNKLSDVPARPVVRTETVVDPEAKPSRYYRLATPRQP